MSVPVSPYTEGDAQNAQKGSKGSGGAGGGAGGSGSPHTPLAIENKDFVFESESRSIRLLAELHEFPRRVRAAGIRGTYLVFGSARAMSPEQWDATHKSVEDRLKRPGLSDKERGEAQRKLDNLLKQKWMTDYFTKTEELCMKLTTWSRSPNGVEVGRNVNSHFPSGAHEQPLIVCTGGGPGFMEAGNKGAAAAGGPSMGVAVTLPFENNLNKYVTDGLNFRTEYFFTRKYWEVYAAKAMICAPGGMGTCDETFEVLTLMQTGHCQKMPVVLLGKEFWRDIINFDKMAKYGVCSEEEVRQILVTDDAEEAFQFVKNFLVKEAEANSSDNGNKTPR